MKSADAGRKTANDFWSRSFYQDMTKSAAAADNCAFCHLRPAQTITFKAFRSEVKSLASMIF